MAMHDVDALQDTIDTLKEELSRSRIQAEVFRALYARQPVEIEQLRAELGDAERAPHGRRLRVVRSR